MSSKMKTIDDLTIALREAGYKVRAIAHLIEIQGDCGFEVLDAQDVQMGIGLILTACSETVLSVARKLEDDEIKAASSKKS